jgi:hypothetical protein
MSSEVPNLKEGQINQEDKPLLVEEDLRFLNLSKRDFLKGVGLGIIGVGTAAAFPAVYEGIWNSLGKEALENSINDLERELSEIYGIPIKVWERAEGEPPGTLVNKSLQEYSLYRALKSLECVKEVLDFYPPEVIRDNVNGIDIVYSVRGQGDDESMVSEAITSFSGQITIRAGHQSMFSYRAIFGEVLDIETLHHEIAHDLTRDITEEDWLKLHPNANYIGSEWTRALKDRPEGFVSSYGSVSFKEDIATISALLISRPEQAAQLAQEDEVLRRKMEYLRNWYALMGVTI